MLSLPTFATASPARNVLRCTLALALLSCLALQANAAPEPDNTANAATKKEAIDDSDDASETAPLLKVGQATGQLLQMQRKAAPQRPRPIDGDQAGRSYQRYLKSFEFAIPEHYSTGIDTGSSGGR